MNLKKSKIKNYISNNFKIQYPYIMIIFYCIILFISFSTSLPSPQSCIRFLFWHKSCTITVQILMAMYGISLIMGIVAGYVCSNDINKKIKPMVNKNMPSSFITPLYIIIVVILGYIAFNISELIIIPVEYLIKIIIIDVSNVYYAFYHIVKITWWHLFGIFTIIITESLEILK